MPEQEQPKPCPICAPDKSDVNAYDLTETLSVTRVGRGNCGLMIRSTDMSKAITLWNTRHEPDEVVKLRAVMQKQANALKTIAYMGTDCAPAADLCSFYRSQLGNCIGTAARLRTALAAKGGG